MTPTWEVLIAFLSESLTFLICKVAMIVSASDPGCRSQIRCQNGNCSKTLNSWEIVGNVEGARWLVESLREMGNGPVISVLARDQEWKDWLQVDHFVQNRTLFFIH